MLYYKYNDEKYILIWTLIFIFNQKLLNKILLTVAIGGLCEKIKKARKTLEYKTKKEKEASKKTEDIKTPMSSKEKAISNSKKAISNKIEDIKRQAESAVETVKSEIKSKEYSIKIFDKTIKESSFQKEPK